MRQLYGYMEEYRATNDGSYPSRPVDPAIYERAMVQLLRPHSRTLAAFRCPSSPPTNRPVFPMDYGFNWDSFAGKTLAEAKVQVTGSTAADGQRRYVEYLFDEWRVDQGPDSYTWHTPNAEIGVNNEVNVLWINGTVTSERGWDKDAFE